MADQTCDFLVIGAGMAGASAGYFLAPHGKVIVLERETAPGYHTTGRSAAFYAPSYGNEFVRPLTLASGPFLKTPPEGFTDVPLLSPRGGLYIGREDQLGGLTKFHDRLKALTPNVSYVDAAGARGHCSILREDYVAGAVWDPDCFDIDVNALHQGYLRGLHRAGGRVLVDAEARAIVRTGDSWRVETQAESFSAPYLINAAGAWADEIARMAGVEPLGLMPLRRTVVMLPGPPGYDPKWPLTLDVDDDFYFKPDSGRMLTSPGDETPDVPSDVQPEELDIAITIDRIQKAADIPAPRIESSWAGLRTFAPDRTPVGGLDPDAPGFYWCAGQGGYGIKTSPILGRVAAERIVNGRFPEDLADSGMTAETYGPARFR